MPPGRRRQWLVPILVLGLLVKAVSAGAACDPSSEPDKTDVANARLAVATNCDCAGAATHGAYVSCAVGQADAVLTNKSCASFVKKCAARSTCGKHGAVTCCLTTANGTKCKIKKDTAHCTLRHGTVGACTSCCDSCAASGNGPSCPLPTTTTTTTTSTTTTPPPPCGPLTQFNCTCPGVFTCQSTQCIDGGVPSCPDARAGCAASCVSNGGDPTDCESAPCVDCTTAQPCTPTSTTTTTPPTTLPHQSCGVGPACGGSCPVGQTCVPPPLNASDPECFCFDQGGCTASWPACDGTCSSGGTCAPFGDGVCACVNGNCPCGGSCPAPEYGCFDSGSRIGCGCLSFQ